MALTKVKSGGITDSTIDTADIADDAVTNAKIAAGAVGGTQLGSNAVTAAKIGSSEVTAAAIAAGAVGTAKVADDAVTYAKMQNTAQGARLLGRISAGGGQIQEQTAAEVRSFLNVADGATASSGTTINNNADDRVITGSGTANTLNGESNVRIDSSGRVLIGTTTEGHTNGDEVTIAKDSGNMGITLRSGDSSNSHIYFSDATGGAGEYAGYIAYQHSDNSMHIGTDSSERIHIKSDGKIGIGTSSPANKLHVEDSASGVIVAKQTTNNGGFNTFEGKSSGGTTTFYASHNGRVGASDGIIFGSDTAAGNVLDDYEEGSWTPSYYPMSSGLTHSYDLRTGSYVKIGRVCYWQFRMRLSSMSGNRNQGLALSGFPFNVDGNQPQASANFYCEGWDGEQPVSVLYQGNVNRATFYFYNSSQAYQATSCLDLNTSNSYIAGSGFFFVA